jgi:hypothetical protein
MTRVLADRCPGAKVYDVTIVTRDDGTNRRCRFAVEYAEGDGPASVFLKAHNPKHRLVHLRNRNLFGEARLFGSGAQLPVDRPFVYRSVIDRKRLDFLIVMEDLAARGADPRDATRPMTVDQVADGVRALARLHSRYWGFSSRSEPSLRWVRTWAPTKGWQVGLRKRVPTGLERAGDTLPDDVARRTGDDIVDLWVRSVTTLTRGPMTLLHADAHIGNTYVLPDDTVGFLDWQVVRRGNWSQDVGYFLVGALTTDDRRAADVALLEEYRGALTVPDAERPTADEVRLRYRASAAYGLAIWLSTLGTTGWQAHEVSLALAQRYASAFVELDAVDALDRVAAG